MTNDFNDAVVAEFRAAGGRVGMFEGARLLLLTTTGARSGAPHTVPLGYLPDGGDRVLVIGSAGGGPRHPAWFHNLLANPDVTVEDGTFVGAAKAAVLTGAERDRAFARAVESDPGWAAYQAATDRVIPVVALESVPGPPRLADGPGGTSGGAYLRRVHGAFRRELALIRTEARAGGAVLGAQLRANCLTVCVGLHHHHAGEDAGMFPLIVEQRPELAPVVARLRAEHHRVAELVAALQAVLAGPADAAVVLREVERLTDELERHLVYEEEQLIPVLDAAAG